MDLFLYETPLWLTMPAFVLAFLALSWMVVLLLRPWVKRAARTEEWDRILGYAMSSYGIFYGILLALIAVSVYENFQRVDGVVVDEISALGALYRDTSGYPEPLSGELQRLLQQYTEGVVTLDWPSQELGIIPSEGNTTVDAFQNALFGFEPVTTGDQAVHAQTIGEFNEFLEARRARLEETDLALPPLLWVLLGFGAVLNAVMIALIEARRLRVHLIMSGIIAVFVAMLVFVTASMDHPYSGYVSITPAGYQELLDDLMR